MHSLTFNYERNALASQDSDINSEIQCNKDPTKA